VSIEQLLRLAKTPAQSNFFGGMGKEAAEESWAETEINIRRFLAASGITDELLTSMLGILSWGQRRLAAIGAVLMTSKKIILLDEPFVGLSEASAEALHELLLSEARRRLIVVVEHDLDRIRKLTKMILALAGGRIARSWSQDDIKPVEIISLFGLR
jgi:ABC-type uncharacterized transport system ATPase subunit